MEMCWVSIRSGARGPVRKSALRSVEVGGVGRVLLEHRQRAPAQLRVGPRDPGLPGVDVDGAALQRGQHRRRQLVVPALQVRPALRDRPRHLGRRDEHGHVVAHPGQGRARVDDLAEVEAARCQEGDEKAHRRQRSDHPPHPRADRGLGHGDRQRARQGGAHGEGLAEEGDVVRVVADEAQLEPGVEPHGADQPEAQPPVPRPPSGPEPPEHEQDGGHAGGHRVEVAPSLGLDPHGL